MASPWKEQIDKFKDIDDEELIDEIEFRGLMDDIQYPYNVSLDDFSNTEIFAEFRARNLIVQEFENLYELISQGKPYEKELVEFIYKYTGRIL